MDDAILIGLFDELEKIGAPRKGPGSRGGKVVGYRKSGRPIYSSEVEKVPIKKPPAVARVVQGAMGTGMIAAQVPLLKRVAKGKATLYHGTDLSAAESIMSSKKGLDPSFAGAGKRLVAENSDAKKVMVNRHLMGESFNRLLERNKVPLSHEQLAGTAERFHQLMDDGMKSGPAAEKIFKELTDDLVSAGKMTPATASKVRGKLGKELARYGQRVYMGFSPADVANYGTGKSEFGKVVDAAQQSMKDQSTYKGQAKRVGRVLTETMTAGLPTTIKDHVKRVKYKPSSVETMTIDQVRDELANIRKAGKKPSIVFGASTNLSKMGYLEDFPVARRFLEANPGIKHSLKDLGVETYEAGKDMSFPHQISRKNIKSVDLIDKATGKIRRIVISGAKEAGRAGILRRVRQGAFPAAIAALGGYSIYRSLVPKKRMVSTLHPLADVPAEKQASVASDMRNVAKYVVPLAVGSGALGYGIHRGLEKAVPKRYPKNMTEQLAEVPRTTLRLGLGTLLATAGGAGLGALAGAAKPNKMLGRKGSAILGAGIGYTSGNLFGTPAMVGREAAMIPETDPQLSLLPDKARDWVRKHPGAGAAKEVATTAAIPLSVAYTLRKYYPGLFAKGVLSLKDVVKALR